MRAEALQLLPFSIWFNATGTMRSFNFKLPSIAIWDSLCSILGFENRESKSAWYWVKFKSGSGKFINDEIVYQGANLSVATAQAIVHDFTPNTHVDLIKVKGTFASGQLKGNTSSALWTINTISDTATMNAAFEDIVDNARIEAESDGIIDFTETNPFGEP